jgi:hypothetical protein
MRIENSWKMERCLTEKAGQGFVSLSVWMGIKQRPAFPTDDELTVKFATVFEDYRVPNIMITHKNGLAGTLLCSTVGYELSKRGVKGVWLETKYYNEFAGQPYFEHVMEDSYASEWLVEKLGGKVVFPRDCIQNPGHDYDEGPGNHVLREMCLHAGIVGEIELRPYFYFDTVDLPELPPRFVAVQGMGSAVEDVPMPTKDWSLDKYQQAVTEIQKFIPVVQIGFGPEPDLPAQYNLKGQLTLEQMAQVLAKAECFLGQPDSFMHLARAVDCPAVIVFGGREKPWQTGYPVNINLVGEVPCSPCWLRKNCPHEMACMKSISVEQVLEAVKTMISRPHAPVLEAEKVVIA